MATDRIARRLLLAVRRSRLMPASSVDRLADGVESAPAATVMVYFPTAPNTLYQLRAWYRALRALHAEHPVLVVCRDSRTARAARTESGLATVSVATLADLDHLVHESGVSLALYPNLDVLDFEALSFPRLAHVYIGHGDSEKAVFSSHQVAAFDRYFVATDESVQRVADQLVFLDAPRHCIVVGEPQSESHDWDEPAATDPPTVVYAPTWEGPTDHDAHSSLWPSGASLVESLLARGLRVVYRPHPLTGTRDPRFATADADLRRLVWAGGGLVDTHDDLVAAFRGASALVCDVSAVASQWRGSGRPLVVLRPGRPVQADAVIDDLQEQWAQPPAAPAPQPSATARFVAACTEVMAELDRRLEERAR